MSTFLPVDERLVLAIGARLKSDHEQLKRGGGYDHNFILNRSDQTLALAASFHRRVDPECATLNNMRIRVSHLKDRKQRRERFAVLTVYDATMARLLERAGIDVMLVGDSVATAVLGYDTTLPVTLDVMIHHTAAVVRGTEKALVIADMPFLTYQITPSEAVRNAGRLLKDAGAAAVKVEGGQSVIDVVKRLVDVGIPVMGHLGVLPQSVNQQSGYRQRGRDAHEADLICRDALALQDAGAFAIVLEAIPPELAAKITAALEVPTVGIGAGPDCDGQVLVSSDLLGLHDKVPPFAKKYANLAEIIVNAARAFIADVHATSSDRVRND